MRLQQFQACCSFHLAADHAGQILLHGQFVDGRYLVGLHHQSQGSLEHLSLLALPMEVDTNGHIIQRERSLWRLGRKCEFTILVAIPQDTTL